MEDRTRIFLMGVRHGLLIILCALERALNIPPVKRKVVIIHKLEEEEPEK